MRFSEMREFRAPDGSTWRIEVRLPGASNAMVVFHQPPSNGALGSRYAWYIWRGPEARSVTSRVAAGKVLETLTDADLERLYRRSMPIATVVPVTNPAAGVTG
jgi:hypothetical protein